MTTIAFLPNSENAPPFSAILTLDGQAYTFAVAWNLYSARWYFSLTDQSGNLVVNQPLIGSPPNANIYLAPGIFTTSTLVYRVSTQNLEIGP
ncbi:MAG: phage baseplate plug family protein [Gammaproteobacteria bacterium]